MLTKSSISLVIGEWGFLGTYAPAINTLVAKTFHLWPVFAASIPLNSVALSGFCSGFSGWWQLYCQPPWSPWAVLVSGGG